MRTLVIIPTYNEAENIGPLLAEVFRAAPTVDVLVVDDNSPDRTFEVVEAKKSEFPRLNLLWRPAKQGLAAAYIAGFDWGLARQYDALIEMDADFSHRPQDLPRFLETLESADAVVGCRYMAGGSTVGWSWLRQGISRGGNGYARWVLKLEYDDLTGGFNAWRADVLRKIDTQTIRSKGYAFQVELKYRAHKLGFRVKEIPIHFDTRKYGKSKMSSRIVWEAALKVWQLKRHYSVL